MGFGLRARTRAHRLGSALLVGLLLATVACSSGDDDDVADEGTGDVPEVSEDDETSEEGLRGGELKIAVGMVMSSVDPHNELHEGERPYTFAMYDFLTQLEPSDLSVKPMLATEWEFSEDGLTLALTVRDDVTFHDGTPFDADAVKVNLDRARDAEQATVAHQLAAIESVEVVSPTEVSIALNQPAPELLARFAGPAGAMISPTAFTEGRDLRSAPGLSGSGPYVIDAFTPSESISFVPAPTEPWDETVNVLDRLEFLYIPDPRTRDAAIRTGEIDAAQISGTPDDIAAAERLAEAGEHQFLRVPTGSVAALMFRNKVAPVDDLRVRQAIAHAIDRQAIVDDLLEGGCTPTAQLFPEGWPGHIEDFEDPYPYDPEAASALAEEAGFTGPLEILAFAGAGDILLPEVIRSQLSEVGITAEISALAPVEALTRFRTDAAPSWMFAFLNTVDPAVSVIDGVLGAQLGADSPAVLEAVEATKVLDPGERTAALENLASVVADEALLVPICFSDSLYVAINDVVGLDDAAVPYTQYMLDVRRIGRADS